MADGLPPITFDITPDGVPVVIVDGTEVTDVAALVAAAPGLATSDYAVAFAQLVNHLSQGYETTLIVDPAKFRAEYEDQIAGEDTGAEPSAGRPRLSEFGTPDFSVITPPTLNDGTLVFFVRQNFYGLPYRVELRPGGEPVYEPSALN